jgi:hypothetical protein
MILCIDPTIVIMSQYTIKIDSGLLSFMNAASAWANQGAAAEEYAAKRGIPYPIVPCENADENRRSDKTENDADKPHH